MGCGVETMKTKRTPKRVGKTFAAWFKYYKAIKSWDHLMAYKLDKRLFKKRGKER